MSPKFITTLLLMGVTAILAINWYDSDDANPTHSANTLQNPVSNQVAPEQQLSLAPNNAVVAQPNLIAPSVHFDNYHSKHGPLAHSLRGTSIPAAFTLGPNGHLVVTPSIKSVIEYFLSATGEEPLETIVARIEEFFSQHLKEPALGESLDILAQYIGYKESLLELEKDLAENIELSGKTSDYQTMFQYRREARMNSLSPEIYDAFFAKEDMADSYTAGLLEINRDKSLTPEQKTEQSIGLEGLLPPEERAHKEAERTRETLNSQINEARKEGATDEEVFQMRSEIYGFDAAERFAAADQKKAKWNKRFSEYRAQRQNILSNSGLSDADKANEIYTIQTELFNERERRRITTLDKIADQQAKP